MPFEFNKLAIEDVVLVSPKVLSDDRGDFAELFKFRDFESIPNAKPLTQVNWSRSNKNVLRGLHYQINPNAQAKLVSCVVGEIFDVAVDIRKGSPTEGKWVGEMLSADNKKMLYIPHGFAHGFCVVSEVAEVIYFCDQQYAPDDEGGVLWNDPSIEIEWPIAEPILTERDAAFPPLAEARNNFEYSAS